MNDWVVLIVVFATVFISSPLIAIFHEMGHAFAYLTFTKPERIDVYVGSYGGEKKHLNFNVGKLHFYVRQSFPFIKGIGLCRSYKAEPDYLRDVLILLAGPFFTFFSAAIFASIILFADASLYLKIICYILLGFSFLSLIVNLFPSDIREGPYRILDTGNGMENDGKQIIFNLKIRKLRTSYVAAFNFMAQQEYDLAHEKLLEVLNTAPKSQKVFRLIIGNLLNAARYHDALFFTSELESNHELSATDLLIRGFLHSLLLNHDEAISAYSAVLKKDKNNLLALNNIGSELIEKGAHEVAKRALERAIKLNPSFDHAYANLGYSKIIQGELAAGKILVDKCLRLNPKHADAYKALSVYYLKLKNAELASKNRTVALELDPKIDFGHYLEDLNLLAGQEYTTVKS